VDLGAEHFGIAQAMLGGECEQLVIGHAAPQEIREARGELEIVQAGFGLDAEQELGRDQDGFDG